MHVIVTPKFHTVPADMQNFSICGYEVEFDDPYIKPYPTYMDYKTIGEQKEAEIFMRCYEHGWIANTRRFGESNEIDALLIKNNDDVVHINIQIRGLIYQTTEDLFTLETTCTRNGNTRARINDAQFILAWSPFVITNSFSRRRGVYVVPKTEFKKYARRMRFYPHREPSNISKGNLKTDNLNDYFEAWHLLDEFRGDLVAKLN